MTERPFSTARLRAWTAPLLLLCALAAACGKKGPPLAPLNMAPEAPQGVSARRLGDTLYVQFTVPAKGVNGSGPFSIDHVEVYGVTLAPGAVTPPNRDLLKPAFVVSKIPVRPLPDPDAEPVEGKEETRPAPGDVITFVERITPALLTPQEVTKPLPPSKETTPPAVPPVAAPAPAAPAGPVVLTRLYSLQGVGANGGRGPASTRVSLPLVGAPGAPRPGSSPTFDQTSVTIGWQPPPATSDEAPGVTYNVYAAPAADPAADAAPAPAVAPAPLNDKPLEVTSYTHPESKPGQAQCFVVRSVATVGTMTIESEPSERLCVTPADTFAPKAPAGLAAVSGPGVINLIWDPNTESDLAGYVVLRGEAPGDTLQPLTPEPIRETRYVDRNVQPGVTYVYAVLAVDRASPANRSVLSNRVQETAR